MVRYRIEAGRSHGAEPKHIVGAIANEAGIESRYIGHIKLFDDFSTVELPDGMPKHVFQHLKNVRVCGRKLNITPDQGPGGKSAGDKPAFKKPGCKKVDGGSGKGKRRDNAAGKRGKA